MSEYREVGGRKVQPHELAAQGAPGHDRGCFCQTCHTLKAKIMTTQAWLELHSPHGPIGEEPYPHPSGEWIRLVCPCGAGQITIKRGGIIL